MKAIEDKVMIERMYERINKLDAASYEKLDKVDQDALTHWYRNCKQLTKAMNIETPKKTEMKRIIELYKIYGSQKSVLVNAHENPFVLSVRDRNFELQRQHEQLQTIR